MKYKVPKSVSIKKLKAIKLSKLKVPKIKISKVPRFRGYTSGITDRFGKKV